MGLIDIFKSMLNTSSIERLRKNREHRESTLGLLDEKQECYLCAVKPLSLLTLQHLELATIASPYYFKLGNQSYTLETNNQTELRNGSASLVCCRLVLVPRSPAEYKSALQSWRGVGQMIFRQHDKSTNWYEAAAAAFALKSVLCSIGNICHEVRFEFHPRRSRPMLWRRPITEKSLENGSETDSLKKLEPCRSPTNKSLLRP